MNIYNLKEPFVKILIFSNFWPVKGQNILTATIIERDEHLLGDVRLRDVELEIKYLMGKSFHREYVDPDLGHYEHSGM